MQKIFSILTLLIGLFFIFCCVVKFDAGLLAIIVLAFTFHFVSAFDTKESDPLNLKVMSREVWIKTEWITEFYIEEDRKVYSYYLWFKYKTENKWLKYGYKNSFLGEVIFTNEEEAMKHIKTILTKLKKKYSNTANVKNELVLGEYNVASELEKIEI